MRVVVQRSLQASCKVNNQITGKIQHGFVLLVGFTEGDDEESITYMAKKVANLRVFDDENDAMNKSIQEIGGSILSVSQFTLYGDCKKGNRPSYKKALKSEEAKVLYDKWNRELKKYCPVETGIFGENMKIQFTNDGPVTILLER